VVGGPVNTAARIQSTAAPMSVAIGPVTRSLVGPLFELETIGTVELRGLSGPLELARVLGARSRTGLEPEDRATPFVGRAPELELLVRAFERMTASSTAELVTIVGEPGIGKSRLVREFARVLEERPEVVTWRQGRSVPYGEGSVLSALADIVGSHAGIAADDEPEAREEKLDGAVPASVPDRDWVIDRMRPLVGLDPTGARPSPDESFAAWRAFVASVATGPLVMVVEDLHWADDLTVGFLADLGERAPTLPLLLIVTTRPDIEDRHHAWPPRIRRSTVLSLGSLSGQETARLLERLLPADASATIRDSVLERAAGNPLFAEQLAAMVREASGAGGRSGLDGAIPPSIHASIAARIDALPSELTAVVRSASVLGRDVSVASMTGLTGLAPDQLGRALEELARREFLRAGAPLGGNEEETYAFWHALVRDVAYGQLPRADRLRLHTAAAETLEGGGGASADRRTGSRTSTGRRCSSHATSEDRPTPSPPGAPSGSPPPPSTPHGSTRVGRSSSPSVRSPRCRSTIRGASRCWSWPVRPPTRSVGWRSRRPRSSRTR
jgi:hypothetical protein